MFVSGCFRGGYLIHDELISSLATPCCGHHLDPKILPHLIQKKCLFNFTKVGILRVFFQPWQRNDHPPQVPKKKLCRHVTHTPASACHHPSPVTLVLRRGDFEEKSPPPQTSDSSSPPSQLSTKNGPGPYMDVSKNNGIPKSSIKK